MIQQIYTEFAQKLLFFSFLVLNGGYRCIFHDGQGVYNKFIGYYKEVQCINACLKSKEADNNINGVSVYNNASRKGCWCLKNMPHKDNNKKFKSCKLDVAGKNIFQ